MVYNHSGEKVKLDGSELELYIFNSMGLTFYVEQGGPWTFANNYFCQIQTDHHV
jgi:hypothetical protein